ncbi:cytochrome P450 [Tolypothrix sp. FACHB-123]|uniref:cytochrome P450 n=1 Tax=Tolypothrix sp. FACHB-123 TaxID=2692868 RepID=UPI001689CD70|nr:cytochrome P450 [Tolypothrix sp. FACHB-123]MBD2359486.1 cytochrome P450 [Tolypothrix sp. FACHB-123]
MKLPNGPKYSAFVQMLQWIFQPMPFMEACAKRYGDIFTMQLNAPVVFVSNPQALQQMLTSDTKEFEVPSDFNTVFEPMLGKNSVITVSGEVHRRQRQLLMPPFHGDRMRTYGQVINQVTEQVISQWQIDKPFCIREAMQIITMRVIMQAVFGLYEGQRAQELEELLAVMLNENSPLRVVELYFPALRMDLGPRSSWGRFLRRKQRVHQLLNAEIQERRDNPDPSRTDILSLLMAARDEAGEAMTDEELRDELMTLLTAGHETTATALTWALYWIHKLPAVKQKLVQELDSLGENPDPSSVFKSPYLNAVCCEALRIYPVGMLTFPRVVREPVSLCGYDLEPGTVVLGSIYLTHQREDLYPQHQQFKPERFLERQFSPYEFLPFGGGARRCIGMAFAQYEMKVILAKILSSWDLALVDENLEIRPKRRGLVTGPNRSIEIVAKQQHQLQSRALESTSI